MVGVGRDLKDTRDLAEQEERQVESYLVVTQLS